MNWVDHIVNERSDFESPLSFWKWSAISAISAIVKDNIYLDRHLYLLYPNIYVMFHAESGMKKGPPVNLAKRLVQLIGGTRVISGRSSIQGILKELGTNTSHSEKGGNIVKVGSSAFICSSELTSSIVDDKVAMDILTDLYDRNYNLGEWRSLLKMESFTLKSPTLTMLTATNEAHSSEFFGKKDIKGGYFARTFIIHETKENKVNSLLIPPVNKINMEKDAEYLKCLSNLKGPFEPLATREHSEIHHNKFEEGYFSDTGIIYERWYRSFKEQSVGVRDPTGTLNRFGDSVLKVAMLLSLSIKPELVITPPMMEEAIETCEKFVGNVRKITLGKGQEKESSNSERKTLLIQELLMRENHQISRAQLNKKYWLQGQVEEWDAVCVSMKEAGFLTIEPMGNHIIYKMTDDSIEEMERYLQGKIK